MPPQPSNQGDVLNTLAFSAAPVALSLIDLDGRLLNANPAYLELFGIAPDDYESFTALQLTHPDDQERTREYLGLLASGLETEVITEKRYVRADGSSFIGRLVARPLCNDDGAVIALLGMIQDLTQQQVFDEVQRELAAQRAVAAVAADAAHELNNLLTSLLLRLDLADSATRGEAMTLQPARVAEIRTLLERATRLGAQLVEQSGDRLEGLDHADGEPGATQARPRILVVDDEATLLETVAEILRNSGYDVVIATNGSDALDAARDQTIGLLVTDLVMPVMDGVTLAERLRAINPELPVLFITGQAGTELARRLPGDATVLRKPFRALELVSSIARLTPEVA